MLFSNNDNKVNERILYRTKPNMLLGCKKAIYGFILLALVFFISPIIIQFIGEMQVYLISYVKLSLTRYVAIAFFVIILIIIIYIIWQLVGWYSMEYTLTDTKIIIKSGVLSTKRNYMPYATIQDINTSQSVFARLFNVGSVSLFSAYDNNQMVLENIHNPSEVEEIIFSNMMGYRNIHSEPQQRFADNRQNQYNRDDYLGKNDFYDDFEPITPIGHEKIQYSPRREYEYYPEDFSYDERPRNNYEYEEDIQTYRDDYARHNDFSYETPRDYSESSYYDEVREDYFNNNDNHYQNNQPEIQYDEVEDNFSNNEPKDMDEMDSSETVIKRHFNKFKK